MAKKKMAPWNPEIVEIHPEYASEEEKQEAFIRVAHEVQRILIQSAKSRAKNG